MKLSIITINFNNASDLANTISSVVAQSWKDFEYIIIDGNSTDNSVEIIKSYAQDLAYWISEPDTGIYNAMNKGLKQATGEYLLMLNAGDLLCDNGVLQRVFTDNHTEDILIGNVYRSVNGKVFDESHYQDTLTFDFFRRTSISHQGTFIKSSLHDIIGYYDESFVFASDWKFFILAICKYNVTYKHLPIFIANCDCGGLTWNPKNFPAMRQEMSQVFKQYFPAFLNDYDNYDYLRSRTFKRRLVQISDDFKSYLKRSVFKSYYRERDDIQIA